MSSIHEALDLIPNTTQTGHGSTFLSPLVWEVKAQGPDVQGHPRLHIKLEASLDKRDYMRPFLKKTGVEL